MGRGDLTDQQWQQLQPLLPPQKPITGRPAKDHRTIINGILWVLRTGAPWRDLPEHYGPWPGSQPVLSLAPGWPVGAVAEGSTEHSNIQRKVHWELHYVDGTMIRAHQHAAGARGKTRKARL